MNNAMDPHAVPDTAAMMARARELLGERYAMEAGVDSRFEHLARHSHWIGLGGLLVSMAALLVPAFQAELLVIAFSAMLARVIHVQTLLRKIDRDRRLADGEVQAWARWVSRIEHPPKQALVATAVDTLSHPYAKVSDLARQCTTIAALEASLACRQRHGMGELQG